MFFNIKNNNVGSSGDLEAKMDAILEMIHGYKGKANAIMEKQRKFEEKMVTLEQENNMLKTQFVQVNNTDHEEESNTDKEEESNKNELE